MTTKSSILLFDGVCNFCNKTVQFVLQKNKKNNIKFAAIQSPAGQKLLTQYGLQTNQLSTIIFIDNEKVFVKSSAALHICKHLGGLFPLLYGFIIIPSFIRNSVYDWVAKNRYKWFGKTETCMVPSATQKERFL